jgi:fucose permease
VTRPRSLNLLLWLVAIGFFMQTLDATIVNTALPAMASSLGESPLRMQSVVVGYTLTMALLIPASGWLADRFGTRRVFMSAIVLFVIGSALWGERGARARTRWARSSSRACSRGWAAPCCCRWGASPFCAPFRARSF